MTPITYGYMHTLSVTIFVINQTILVPFFTLDDFMCRSIKIVRVRIAYAAHMVTVTNAMDLSGEDIAVIKVVFNSYNVLNVELGQLLRVLSDHPYQLCISPSDSHPSYHICISLSHSPSQCHC